MPISEAPRPWDVVVLPFPYADKLAEKRRPGLIVSTRDLTARHRVVWVALITSAVNASCDKDIDITDLAQAGLKTPSAVRPAKMATVDVSRIIRIAGSVDMSVAAATRRCLLEILAEAR